ncbi:hypothetical protein [Citreimonas salinaria]|uniref:VanZ like family protein n=1 Tax=Citreimonas salinaria TaxID=321339 RepID=A0A1H3LLI6_9RHOB|nr:hypothetical protein [Citreimonas salinaria]SDY64999.1 hypothetical protein SAMN05444340_11371 [Citreimonas salinaria]
MNRFQWLAVSAAALVSLLLGVGAFLPGEVIGSFVPGTGQRLHAAGFGMISFLIVLAFPERWLLFGAVALAAGGLVEFLQPLAGRGTQWADFGANAAGLAAGVSAALLVRRATRGR